MQTQVPADSPDKVRTIVEAELGEPIDTLFETFELTPIASASIGQVHQATLFDGTPVVVKVQHHDIQNTVREDLDVLAGLAVLAERIPEIAAWQPKTLVEQLSKSLMRELSFTRELHNLQFFQSELHEFAGLHIPKTYLELSSPRVLTMERLEGRSISKLQQEDAELSQQLTKRTAELYMEMIFRLGVYHADPHPGNILITEECRLGLLDFGMVGRIDDRLRETIEEMLMAVATRDSALLTSLIKRVGKTPLKLDESNLSIDVAELISTYGSQPLDSFDLAGASTM